MLSSALFWVSRLVTGLLFTSWGATSGPGYKYCVWFLVSHLSAALGVHGEHSSAQVCFSSADTRWRAESRHQPATFLLEHSLLAFGSWAAETSRLDFTIPSSASA